MCVWYVCVWYVCVHVCVCSSVCVCVVCVWYVCVHVCVCVYVCISMPNLTFHHWFTNTSLVYLITNLVDSSLLWGTGQNILVLRPKLSKGKQPAHRGLREGVPRLRGPGQGGGATILRHLLSRLVDAPTAELAIAPNTVYRGLVPAELNIHHIQAMCFDSEQCFVLLNICNGE